MSAERKLSQWPNMLVVPPAPVGGHKVTADASLAAARPGSPGGASAAAGAAAHQSGHFHRRRAEASLQTDAAPARPPKVTETPVMMALSENGDTAGRG